MELGAADRLRLTFGNKPPGKQPATVSLLH